MALHHTDIISAEAAGTLPGLFLERVARTPAAVAYREFDPAIGGWCGVTWRQMSSRVAQFQAALAKEGLVPGDRVAILLANSIDWVAFDIAAMGLGLVVVPLFAHDSMANASGIIGHSEAKLLFTDTWKRWQALVEWKAELAAVDSVWIRAVGTDTSASAGGRPARALADVLPARSAEDEIINLPSPRSIATLIYTSGTTGRPKGTRLTHFALLWNAEASTRAIPPRTDDVFLSFLPLAHAFERTAGYTMAMMGGSTVAFARSIDRLRADFRQVRPTAFVAVPRVFELIHAGVRTRAAQSHFGQRLLDRAAALGWRKFKAEQGRGPAPGMINRLEWQILRHLVARPVLQAFGGRLRVAVSGGAALRKDVLQQLIGLGLPIIEGYGLTEAAPVVATNTLQDNWPGSVGRALPGVELTVSERGELLVRTPAVMSGYWKDEAATAQAIDSDGWLHTGDLAEIRQGRVFIRGRLKDVIVLATGEKVNPGDIEDELTREPLFRQALVVGEGKPYLVAVVVLDAGQWRARAASLGLDAENPNTGAAGAELLRLARERLSDRPRPLQVHFVYATLAQWTIDAGLLTPTLKVKRKPVERLFEAEIQALYKDHAIAG